MHLLANFRWGAHLQALVVHLSKPSCTSLGYAVSLSRVFSKTHADIANVGNPTDLDVQILCKSCKSLVDSTHSDCGIDGNTGVSKTHVGQRASSFQHMAVTCCL